MKVFPISILALTLASSAVVFAERGRDPVLDCVSKPNRFGYFTLKASNIQVIEQNRGTMWNVVMTAAEKKGAPVETGRSAYLSIDADYSPRKYKNHSRFDMSKIIDTENFGSYGPLDQCTINVLVPNDIMTKTQAELPVVMNCDQSGGSFTLNCTLTDL